MCNDAQQQHEAYLTGSMGLSGGHISTHTAYPKHIFQKKGHFDMILLAI